MKLNLPGLYSMQVLLFVWAVFHVKIIVVSNVKILMYRLNWWNMKSKSTSIKLNPGSVTL